MFSVILFGHLLNYNFQGFLDVFRDSGGSWTYSESFRTTLDFLFWPMFLTFLISLQRETRTLNPGGILGKVLYFDTNTTKCNFEYAPSDISVIPTHLDRSPGPVRDPRTWKIKTTWSLQGQLQLVVTGLRQLDHHSRQQRSLDSASSS